ncbi:Crp/Fnr family transcriptional regulator [Grimontia hollisae]|uniref:Crp/Fnr family transcriptional regulator n=1 Tax=Grimontia hollisae TaxID=673 RepID=UPI000E026050|nr:Crp/Fnr family transcriptional regulator [Grimontia hollisae]STQ75062.1 DNA-binding transcriptional dual regulator Crp [Grimontia hollisae]
MRIKPYARGRFKTLLDHKSTAFHDFIYQCQVGSRFFNAGEAMLQQGEPLEHLYVVPVGRVSMSILAANGRRFQLGETHCDDHIFGEMEFFTQTPCQWSVVADEQMQVDIICPKKLDEGLQQAPDMLFFFASALADDYQDSLDIYTSRLLHPITYNIAYDLLAQQQQSRALCGFGKVDQEAERFGTSGRVYRRAVKNLMDRNLIRKGEHGLEIVDEKALKAFLDTYE